MAEALGLALPHSALAPSGEPAWLELGRRSALALLRLLALGTPTGRILTAQATENAMLVHAAFGGSTNLLLHVPAIASPIGNLAPDGSVIKATALDPAVVDADGIYRHRGRARVFTDEREAMRAVKGDTVTPVRPGVTAPGGSRPTRLAPRIRLVSLGGGQRKHEPPRAEPCARVRSTA